MRPGARSRNVAGVEEHPTEPGTAERPASGPVAVMRDTAMVIVLAGDRAGLVVPLEKGELTVGRGEQADIQLTDGGLSRKHCAVMRRDGTFFVRDLKSRNGTWVQGERVEGEREIGDGDRIAIGHGVVLKFSVADDLEAKVARRLYEQTVRDGLTGLYNRGYFDERLVAEVSYGARHNSGLALLMIDVDHFKTINDTYGHIAGDGVLRSLGERLKKATRIEDVVARYGGEEFVILARGIDRRGALTFAERIKNTVSRDALPWDQGAVPVTVSIGIAQFDPKNVVAANDLLSSADEALYTAKKAGRNRIVTFERPLTSSA
jgi:diguanylate cyclase (GGDEF)-like protein